jgi:tetratricopeptide (TPR) repeat protein
MPNEATAEISRALAGRYRIERELGAGGMATVYLAEDLRHDRRVAVKVLRSGFAANLGGGRFLEEIRIAANLTHPHIMPVHDSGEADGFLYYVMPYSEGESLEQRLARGGRLPIADATGILEDVIDALGFAHAHGVVHRDVKPGNIMTQSGHAMIVDFGIAKAVSEASTRPGMDDTAEGMAIGTPEYMAPEQAAADPSVDHRADLYSVGLLAYELLAGQSPFGGGTPQSVLTRQITETPVPVEELRPEIPTALAAWVARCLEKRPSDRWQSADEMLTALKDAGRREGDIGDRSGAAVEPSLRKKAMVGAVASVVIAVAGAFGWSSLQPGELDASSRVVVDVFENLTGDASFDPVGHMLQDWLTDGLLQSGLLEVVPTITARQAADFIDAEGDRRGGRGHVVGLSDETGADIVVSGTLYLDGDDLRIQTSVTDISNRDQARLVGSIDPAIGPASDVTTLFDEVRQDLLGSRATALNRRIRSQVGDSDGAPTFEAYEALDRALGFYVARDYREASELFLRAFELDDSYPVPLVYASLSLRNHNDFERSDSVVTMLEERRAELSEYQRHWVDYSRAVLDGDLDRARITIRRAATLAPQSKAAYNWALTAVRMGRPSEARAALASLDPDRGAMRGIPRYWMRRIEASHHLGEHEEELEEVEELEARYPDERSVFFYKVRVYAALGWAESLRAAFAAPAVSRFPPEVVAIRYRNAAVDLFVHGHPDIAEEFAQAGIDFIDSRMPDEDRTSAFDVGITLRASDQMLYQKGRLMEVLGERAEAIAIYFDLHERNPQAWFILAHMGVIHASLGQISDAMDVDRWLEERDLPWGGGDVTGWRAGIAAGLGDFERATALLQQARQEGMSWTEVHPHFHLYDAMGEYEPFLEMMAPQG